MTWTRWRFLTSAEDWRPVVFPPPGPFWCSGYNPDDHAYIVAYLPSGVVPTAPELWPEAYDLDRMNEGVSIEFSSRFQRPKWWTAKRD